ncbi:Ppx/GppA family phosphatase [Litorimonas sp. WD9-15]|uniref:Ppx/GppA phosphatase family protein n=1 Tax=Litorimonas sp. WD9-15 TaxID=3418716 RepID=UPI003CFE7AB5
MAGLGRDLRDTGCLSVSGKQKCRAALARFSKIIKARGLGQPLIGATAAMREAEDAPDFVAQVKQETGLDISPVSGTEEARLSALGLLSNNDRRQGLGADLGGASLEIMQVGPELRDPNSKALGVSLPLGPFDAIGGNLSELLSADYIARVSKLDSVLGSVSGDLDGEETLYLIGGAWRNLASVHQQKSNYPMRTLQGYRLSPEVAETLAHWAYTDGLVELLNWPGMRKARAETLPYAGLILERLIKRFKPKSIVISMAGLREGLVWDSLPEPVKSRDALIDGCRDFARGFVQAEHFGPPLYRFLSPLLPVLPCGFGDRNDARLLQAACHLAGLGKNLHPDHRAELVFEDVLYAPVAGLTHAERAFLSLSLFRTYTAKRQPPVSGLIDELLTEDQRYVAACIGEAIRLAIVVTGRTPSLLSEFELSVRGEALYLSTTPDLSPMLTEQVKYRVKKLAKLLEMNAGFD